MSSPATFLANVQQQNADLQAELTVDDTAAERLRFFNKTVDYYYRFMQVAEYIFIATWCACLFSLLIRHGGRPTTAVVATFLITAIVAVFIVWRVNVWINIAGNNSSNLSLQNRSST